jgi:hypothetical protein
MYVVSVQTWTNVQLETGQLIGCRNDYVGRFGLITFNTELSWRQIYFLARTWRIPLERLGSSSERKRNRRSENWAIFGCSGDRSKPAFIKLQPLPGPACFSSEKQSEPTIDRTYASFQPKSERSAGPHRTDRPGRYDANNPCSLSFSSLSLGLFVDDSSQSCTFLIATVCVTFGLLSFTSSWLLGRSTLMFPERSHGEGRGFKQRFRLTFTE